MSHPNDQSHITYSSSRPSDQVLSPDGSRLYTASRDGAVRAYDVKSGALLATWNVGISLGGIDVSQDGSFLMVTERQPLSSTGDQWSRETTVTTYKVDTTSGQTTSFPYIARGYDYTFFDVAVMSDGKVLLTQNFSGSGFSGSRILDPATGIYIDGPMVNQSSILSRTPDGSRVLIGEANSSAGPLDIYAAGKGIAAKTYMDGYNWGIQAISADASLIAIYSYGSGIRLYNGALQQVGLLTGWGPGNVLGLAFDPSGAFLYVLDTSVDAVVQVRVSDGTIIGSTPVGHDAGQWLGQVGATHGSNLIIDPNGRTFFALTPEGSVAVSNPAVRVLTGTDAPDLLEGASGNDELSGRGGDDLLVGDAGNDDLYGEGGNDSLSGGTGSDSLNGADGDDLLDGGTGADAMGGGPGNDIYIVDDAGDTVTEAAGEGTDEIRTLLASYSLASLVNVENLTGTLANGQTLTGNDLDNLIFAGMGDDVLEGGAGNDVLIGFGGSDLMRGGAGNDVYIIDAGDTVVEFAGDGIDEVRTQAEIFVLSDALENLRATSDVGHDFRGNAGNNVIVGGDGNDIIRSQDGGDDLLFGKAGVDSFYMGGAFDNGDLIDGGDNRDSLILQGNYNLTLTWNITGGPSIANIEGISLLAGNVTQYGDTAGNFYSYNLTLVDGNVAAGQLMKVNGFNLRAGENFTLDASAELDAPLQVFAGLGTDTFKGGTQGDSFIFGHDGRFGAGDTVDGGAGYDVFYLRGDYIIDFNAAGYSSALTNIESIALLTSQNTEFAGGGDGEFDYDITWNDTLLAAGQSITINASRLGENESLDFDGSREADGIFRLFGGAGGDFLTGGKGNDLIYGGGNGDILNGGGGNDTFRYQSTDDSRSSGNRDGIQDFSIGDKIDLQRIDADVLTDGDQAFTFIGSGAFTGHAGELRAVNTAGFPTAWTVYADVDGDGHEDLTILVQVIDAHPLTAADFVM